MLLLEKGGERPGLMTQRLVDGEAGDGIAVPGLSLHLLRFLSCQHVVDTYTWDL